MKLTIISHFYNEEFLLPYWLTHHAKMFDHGILVNYGSTDDSVKIIKSIAPKWEIRDSRNRNWDFLDADRELMDIESEIIGWKIILNTTEFLLHYNLRNYVNDFMEQKTGLVGVRTNGIVMVDRVEDRYKPLTKEHLIFQKKYGYLESDFAPITKANPLHRSRLLHFASNGKYSLGRHQSQHTSFIDKKLFLLWFGFSPFEQIKNRKLSFKSQMSERNIEMNAGLQHIWNEEQLENTFNKESRKCYNLIDNVPFYEEILRQIFNTYE